MLAFRLCCLALFCWCFGFYYIIVIIIIIVLGDSDLCPCLKHTQILYVVGGVQMSVQGQIQCMCKLGKTMRM